MSLRKTTLGIKRLTLNQLERMDTSFVYVINNTDPRGNLNLTVADGMGNQVAVRVPVCNIPYDLSTQATKQALLSNPQLRTLNAKGVLLFVDPDAAVELLKTPDARDEHKRLFSVGEIAAIGDEEDNSELANVQAEEDGNIHPFAMTMAMVEDGTDEEVIRQLKSREDELSADDYTYIATNSKKDKVKAFAAERAANA